MFKAVLILLVSVAVLVSAQAAGNTCTENQCGARPALAAANIGALWACRPLPGSTNCAWAHVNVCNCSADAAIATGCTSCKVSTTLAPTGGPVYSCAWDNCGTGTGCTGPHPATFTGTCTCQSATNAAGTAPTWICTGCDTTAKPRDCPNTAVCSGSTWTCPAQEKPAVETCGGVAKPAADAVCACVTSNVAGSNDASTAVEICQWKCASCCQQILPAGIAAPSCPCFKSVDGAWEYRCPPTTPPPVPPAPTCFPTTRDTSKCKCVTQINRLTGTPTSFYVCEPSLCPPSLLPMVNCQCVLAAAQASAAGEVRSGEFEWLCPPTSPRPGPVELGRPVGACATAAPNDACTCRCAHLTAANTTACQHVCPAPKTCLGSPRASTCRCLPRILPALDAANADALWYDWDCPIVSPCDALPVPTSAVPCYCDVTGINRDGTKKFGYVCPTCTGPRPRDDCKCTPTQSDAAGVPTGGWTWTCPETCTDVAPSSKCYCGRASNTRKPTWICPEDCTGARTDARQTCTKPPSSGPAQWIRPRPCNSTPAMPSNLPCRATEAKAICDPATDTWSFKCPPRACSCDNMPLPVLDAAVDGCTTRQATWTCVQAGAVDVDVATPAADVHRRPCASWVFRCPTPVPPPNKVDCTFGWFCGRAHCYDRNAGEPAFMCPLGGPVGWDCISSCAKRYGTCAASSVSGVESCEMHYSPEYKECVARCEAPTLPPPNPNVDRCSFIQDKCKCLATNGQCNWCSEQLAVAGAAVELGRCIRSTSDAICLTRGLDLVAADTNCPALPDPNVDPAPTRPPKPTPDDVKKCTSDARCFDVTDINRKINTARGQASTPVQSHTINVIGPLPPVADPPRVRAAVEIISPPSNDPAPHLTEICDIIRTQVLGAVGVDSTRWVKCTMTNSPTPKRQAAANSGSYIVDMQYSASPALVASLALLFVALIAQLL